MGKNQKTLIQHIRQPGQRFLKTARGRSEERILPKNKSGTQVAYQIPTVLRSSPESNPVNSDNVY